MILTNRIRTIIFFQHGSKSCLMDHMRENRNKYRDTGSDKARYGTCHGSLSFSNEMKVVIPCTIFNSFPNTQVKTNKEKKIFRQPKYAFAILNEMRGNRKKLISRVKNRMAYDTISKADFSVFTLRYSISIQRRDYLFLQPFFNKQVRLQLIFNP